MIWATRLFSMYLRGTKFRILTDSRAAKALVEANDAAAGGRLLRWRLALSEFDFDVVHRKGTTNGNADCFSRLPLASFEPYGEGPTDVSPTTLLTLLHAVRESTARPTDGEESLNAFFPPHDDEAWSALE
jgi:hypothetical protein